MKVGDRVKVNYGIKAFAGQQGRIVEPMLPDYQWAVLIDGTEDPTDTYGFNESELECLS